MSWIVAPADDAGHRELAGGLDDVVAAVDDDRGRYVDLPQPGPRVVPAEGGDGLGDRPRARCDRNSASAHSSMSRGSRSRARAAAREACTAVRDRATVRSPSIVAPIPVKNARSGSVIWNRSVVAQSTRPPDLVAVLAPDPLRHDRAHRVAGDDHLLEPEHLDQGAHVVRAVDQRELLRADPLPVPAQVERDHAEPSRQRLDRRKPGQQPGAAERVQQHDGGGLGCRTRGVGDVRRPAARQLDHPALRNARVRQVDLATQPA